MANGPWREGFCQCITSRKMPSKLIKLCEQGCRGVIWKCTWISVGFLVTWTMVTDFCCWNSLWVRLERGDGQTGVGRVKARQPLGLRLVKQWDSHACEWAVFRAADGRSACLKAVSALHNLHPFSCLFAVFLHFPYPIPWLNSSDLHVTVKVFSKADTHAPELGANEAQCWPVRYAAEKLVTPATEKKQTCEMQKCSAKACKILSPGASYNRKSLQKE